MQLNLLVVSSQKGSRELNSKDGDSNGDAGYEVAIIDFPEGSFVVRDATGEVIGNLITNVIDDIVFDMNGLEVADIKKVQMVYSHAHFDHIGGATITYNTLWTTGVARTWTLTSSPMKGLWLSLRSIFTRTFSASALLFRQQSLAKRPLLPSVTTLSIPCCQRWATAMTKISLSFSNRMLATQQS